MGDWTPGTWLFVLIWAIVIPGLFAHLTLGRNGGHHLYGDIPPEKARDLPMDMLRSVWRNQIRGTLAVLIGLGAALSLYPLACRLGIPLKDEGMPDARLVFVIFSGIGLVVVLGLAYLGRRRNRAGVD